MTTTTTNKNNITELECDYLIVGAGATTLAFVDTLLTELPDTKIILLDKKAAPGGHWVDAYGYVKLHQPSIVYGIASKQLEGNWLKCLLCQFMKPWDHRANKTEILKYFADFVNENEQISFYPNSEYYFDKDADPSSEFHSFSSVDGSVSYKVQVNVKLIDGSSNVNIIPHDNPLQFPVDDEVRVMTPNQVYDANNANPTEMLKNKYVVLGAGKTAMDAVVYLQRTMKIDPANIAWVISQDVWMSKLGGGGNPTAWGRALVKHDNDTQKAALEMESKGAMVRLDKKIMPTVFKFPVVPADELKLMQNVKTIIRRGRATAIRKNANSKVTIEFGDDHSPWEAFAPLEKCVFVHCTSPGPFNATKNREIGIFSSDKKMTLSLLFAPPISISMSCLAKVEASRRKGALDLKCMKRLMLAREGNPPTKDYTENELLDALIQPMLMVPVRPMLNLAVVLAICHTDPMVLMDWMKQNRLAFLSIPGYKCMAYEDVRMLQAKGAAGGVSVGLTEPDMNMLELLGDAIQPLEGM
mmetsp:Transcript_10642/g.23503  ORF Transcript_10642/g.23503 Transcript_10642/m.23503 type:complete len:526 (-) Transcript_10642:54-1631(-)|eukprot:CAMPEP_0172325676 /NCGR_PEP_ID=MMETSP1058-20130122/54510_1 /TAXON_ID=83371 /ORGANISM="Detonula confervacea, Strain CCMP 353" /LENGTH=525 /DNA_ID=CAMNT_0013042269 /DNA_START=116 /DNA_END=1693 /DNA_ORIENTATION=-